MRRHWPVAWWPRPTAMTVEVPTGRADANERRRSLRAARGNPASGRIEGSGRPAESAAPRNVIHGEGLAVESRRFRFYGGCLTLRRSNTGGIVLHQGIGRLTDTRGRDRMTVKEVVEIVRTDAEQVNLWTSRKPITSESSWSPRTHTSLDGRAQVQPELSRKCRLRRECRLTVWRTNSVAEFSVMQAEAPTANSTPSAVLP